MIVKKATVSKVRFRHAELVSASQTEPENTFVIVLKALISVRHPKY